MERAERKDQIKRAIEIAGYGYVRGKLTDPEDKEILREVWNEDTNKVNSRVEQRLKDAGIEL